MLQVFPKCFSTPAAVFSEGQWKAQIEDEAVWGRKGEILIVTLALHCRY